MLRSLSWLFQKELCLLYRAFQVDQQLQAEEEVELLKKKKQKEELLQFLKVLLQVPCPTEVGWIENPRKKKKQ